ncbi:hypothetical protein LOY64_05520 [Pseudomonas corrugata]|uniref:hypothetical protein n=1 Tax=Pseudomonas corrugata TaxID=47879 RepID=UPI00222EE360|nr:hypothetical protein [Pseudomonas corrugata]UZD96466.1 hypothetical protein LOY64_05520 [Pseudomonas corrugata]
MKILAGLVAGLILAILVLTAVAIAGAASPRAGEGAGAIVFFVTLILALAIAVSAPTAGKAWRRLLVTSGIAPFMLPLAGIVFTGSHIATNNGAHSGRKPSEPRLAWLFKDSLAFFLGVICLIIGLMVGRDKQVIYIQPPLNS